jgi:murein DD-endopeptidase
MTRRFAPSLQLGVAGRLALVALASLATLAGDPAPGYAQLASPAELRIPKPPTLARVDGAGILAYELHLTNFTAQPLTVRRVEVLENTAAARVLLTLEDTALANAMLRPGVAPPPAAIDRPRITGGLRAVVYLWAPVDSRTPPARLRHRVTLVRGSGESTSTVMVEGGAVAVSTDVATIAPPLRGGPWLAANGPDPVAGHRRALIPIEGTPVIAQRFAIDYVKVDSSGRTFSGDRLKNESYYAQGMEALAVADGRVVATKDSIPENIPGANSRAVPITLETVGGNFVIVDIGNGRYAFYAHLQPGSLRVKVGDRVRQGQVMGLVGNSGNSTEPHLHFHLSDSPSPLGSEGIPYVHERLEVVGRCRANFVACVPVPPEARRGEMPNSKMAVRFP